VTGNDPERALRLATQVLGVMPAGILTDLDGTLAPIASTPEAATPVAGVAGSLATLAAHLAVVGIVTGRAAANARALLGPPGERLLVIGNHGLEWLPAGETLPRAAPELEHGRAAVAAALSRLGARIGPGIRVEDKGLSATVHFRGAPDPAAAGRAVVAALAPLADEGLELREGRMSVELRPVGLGDKGSAVTAVIERHGLRGLVVAGDDVTDLDMFRAARAARERGMLQAVVIGVRGGREVPAAVTEASDVVLASPAAMARLLAALAARVGAIR
jgi:trehalose 6-phosphate phosphatase